LIRTFTSYLDKLAAELGYEDYGDYLQSDWWQQTKVAYRLSELPQCCAVCGCEDFDLHHRDYGCLGDEPLDHLVPLCEDHHREVHKFLDKGYRGVTLWNTHEVYKRKRDERAHRRAGLLGDAEWDPFYFSA
jgi:hypothetical protein